MEVPAKRCYEEIVINTHVNLFFFMRQNFKHDSKSRLNTCLSLLKFFASLKLQINRRLDRKNIYNTFYTFQIFVLYLINII